MKGQGLPITTIIIAALGIIVLVVVGAIFSGQIGKFGRAASECTGRCVVKSPSIAMQNSGATFEQDTACNPEFETRLTGTYIAKGTPKDQKIQDFMCTACCVATG
ncbi:hypothetical protein HY489_04185 [Candidatus Woesearchaeota archaeon]|nr:hypothetical protein [Candidatus Woesearchaeota archaeon]